MTDPIARALARLDAAIAAWLGWAQVGSDASPPPAHDAVLRQRMADAVIARAAAAAVLDEPGTAGRGSTAERQCGVVDEAHAALARDRMIVALRCTADAIADSQGEAAAAELRGELTVVRACTDGDIAANPIVDASADSAFDLAAWEQFCRTTVRAAARATDTDQRISEAVWAGIRERGYLALFHPPSSPALYPAMAALAEACASSFWRATLSSALCGQLVAQFGSPAVQARWLTGLATGALVGAFAATEHGSGSDPSSYAARIRRTRTGWQLSGIKDRITGAGDAALAAVLAPAEDATGAPLGLALAFVALDDPKIAPKIARLRRTTLGLRGMSFGRLAFDEVALAPADVTLETPMPRILTVVEWGQVVQALCGLGVGRAALAEVTRFLGERSSFGRPLLANPAVHRQLVDAERALAAGDALARRALARKSTGAIAGESIVIAKIACSEAGLAACQTALRLAGGWGYTTELDVERYLRDAHGNIPAGLPNDRLRELLIAPRVGVDPWASQ